MPINKKLESWIMLSVGNMWAMLNWHSHPESSLAVFSDVGYVSAEVPTAGLCAEILFSPLSSSALYHGDLVPAGCIFQVSYLISIERH